MDINASIIDQRLTSVVNDIRQKAAEELNIQGDGRVESLAFVYLCVKTILDLEDDDAFDCLTEGGGDFGVDAMHISEEYDGEFTVSLFQAKYKNKLEGNSNFPQEGIESLINAIQYLFDPAAKLEHINQRLLAKVEEARSLIRDGYIPQVRALACNNGLAWNVSEKEAIERTGFGDQVAEQLSGAQVVIAVQLYRIAENRRKRPEPTDPDVVRYASCFIAMQMGGKLLNDMNIRMIDVSHQNFASAQHLIEQNSKAYFNDSVQDIQQALQDLYGKQEISLQQLSATFRRGDLISGL
jgi:hypothetical protein